MKEHKRIYLKYIPPGKQDKMIQLYNGGVPVSKIAAICHSTTETVNRVLDRFGIPEGSRRKRGRKRIPDETRNKIADLYTETTMTQREIAIETGVSVRTVNVVLTEYHVSRRKQRKGF